MAQSDWERLAVRLDLPRDCFGDTMATAFMLDAARLASKARDELAALTIARRALKPHRSAMASLLERLDLEIAACQHRLAAFPMNGSAKRQDARFVADKIASAFKAHGRDVTYGQMPDGETPSTPFCRAVMIGLQELNVNCGWRGPTKAAWIKHRKAT